jgi:hypothetical protein
MREVPPGHCYYRDGVRVAQDWSHLYARAVGIVIVIAEGA